MYFYHSVNEDSIAGREVMCSVRQLQDDMPVCSAAKAARFSAIELTM